MYSSTLTYSALTDIIDHAQQAEAAAAQESDAALRGALDMERGALIRAAAIAVTGAYHSERYMDAVRMISAGMVSDAPGTIAIRLFEAFGIAR